MVLRREASGRVLRLAVLVGVLVAPGCGDDGVPVSYFDVLPGDTVVAPGDTVRVLATPRSPDGSALDRSLRYEVEPASIGTVTADGLFTATAVGVGRVAVIEEAGVRGFAEVEVRRVSGLSPTVAAFGGVVRVRGEGFVPGTDVRFGAGASGIVREFDPAGRWIDAWVPWDAGNGPVVVRYPQGTEVSTPQSFVLTGNGEDALEPNGFGDPVEVTVPFRNPYLMSRTVDLDEYTFSLEAAGPLTVRLADRDDAVGWPTRMLVQLNRADAVQEYVGITPAFAFQRNESQDGVIGRSFLEAGPYVLRVFTIFDSPLPNRRYELIVESSATFELAEDALEPNDFPLEAPVVELPFSAALALENPWSADYVTFEIDERSRVEVSVQASGGGLGVFLFQDDRSVTWLLSNFVRPETFFGLIGPFSVHRFQCVLEPGRYRVGVIENAGNSRPYTASITAEPTTLTFLNCRSGVAPPAGTLRGIAPK